MILKLFHVKNQASGDVEGFELERLPIKDKKQVVNSQGTVTRAASEGKPCDIGLKLLTKKTCVSDAIRLWNRAPNSITKSTTLNNVKKEIKTFVRSLPI